MSGIPSIDSGAIRVGAPGADEHGDFSDVLKVRPGEVWRIERRTVISRLRAWITSQRTSASAEFGHHRGELSGVDPRPPLQTFDPALQHDDADQKRRDEAIEDLTLGCGAFVATVLGDHAEAERLRNDLAARLHRRRQVIQDRFETGACVVGGGHSTSPSLVVDTASVGADTPVAGRIAPPATGGVKHWWQRWTSRGGVR